MKFMVEVEIYENFRGKDSVVIELTEDDILRLAEEKAEKEYTFKSCSAKRIEISGEMR